MKKYSKISIKVCNRSHFVFTKLNLVDLHRITLWLKPFSRGNFVTNHLHIGCKLGQTSGEIVALKNHEKVFENIDQSV